MSTLSRIARTIVEAVALAAPVLALLACAYLQIEQSALLTLLVGCAALAVFFCGFEAGRPALRQVMPTATLAALAAAGRILFAPIPDFKPVSAICIIAGAVFGKHSGFMVGALGSAVLELLLRPRPLDPLANVCLGLSRLHRWGTGKKRRVRVGRRSRQAPLRPGHRGAVMLRLPFGTGIRLHPEQLVHCGIPGTRHLARRPSRLPGWPAARPDPQHSHRDIPFRPLPTLETKAGTHQAQIRPAVKILSGVSPAHRIPNLFSLI